jgi:hypothetical protein
VSAQTPTPASEEPLPTSAPETSAPASAQTTTPASEEAFQTTTPDSGWQTAESRTTEQMTPTTTPAPESGTASGGASEILVIIGVVGGLFFCVMLAACICLIVRIQSLDAKES